MDFAPLELTTRKFCFLGDTIQHFNRQHHSCVSEFEVNTYTACCRVPPRFDLDANIIDVDLAMSDIVAVSSAL
jgi:hypothetical protein